MLQKFTNFHQATLKLFPTFLYHHIMICIKTYSRFSPLSAIGPGAVADLLQQKGQQETSASESNIILTMESVFAALCAFVILGEV